ncbi:MAG: DVUA0089 family protein, partial [Planctomycetota bacterium]
ETSGDIYEPDNTFSTASFIPRNETQNRSIHIVGDEDYVMFTLISSSTVTIETDGPTGDTYLYLYNSIHGTITSDDDSGNGFFSRITRTLPAGTYFIRVRHYSNDDTIAAYTLSLNVILPGSPVIGLSEATLSAECAVGTTAVSQTFEIRNIGGGTLSYSIGDNASWLTCTPTSGSSIGDIDVITINFTTSGLSIGSYSGTITISGNALNTGITLHVNLAVVAPVPEIAYTPTTLQPSCGRTAHPEPLTFEIWNSRYGTLQYDISANQPWLTVHPLFGTSTGERDLITVSFSTTGLDYGTYSATIMLSDIEATNSPRYITVLLTVQRPEIAVAPSSLSSVCWINTDAASKTFTVQNATHDTLNYDISADATWLTLSPTGGVSTGEADVINVVYNTSTLPYGTHTANVTIRDDEASNSPFTFTVTVLINTPYAPPPVRTAFVNGGIYAATECMATTSPLRRGIRVSLLALIIAAAVAFRRARALTAVVFCLALAIPGTAEASSAGGPRLDSDVILPEKSFFYTEQSSFRAIVPARGVTSFPIRFYNIGGNVLKWSIDSLPEWLTADLMSGVLEADQNETLIVSVDVKRLPKKVNESGVREATGLIEFSFSKSYYKKAAIQVLATTSTVDPKPDPDAVDAQPLKSYSLMNRVLVENPADVKIMPDSQATNINMLRSENNSDPNYYTNYATGFMERYRTYGVGVSMDDLFDGKSTDYEPTLGLLLSYRRKPPLTNLGLLAEFAFASTSDDSGDEDVLILTFGGSAQYFLPYFRGSYVFSGLRYGIENRTHKVYDDLDQTTGALAIPFGAGYTFYGTMFDCRASFSILPFTDNIGGLMSFSLLYYY